MIWIWLYRNFTAKNFLRLGWWCDGSSTIGFAVGCSLESHWFTVDVLTLPLHPTLFNRFNFSVLFREKQLAYIYLLHNTRVYPIRFTKLSFNISLRHFTVEPLSCSRKLLTCLASCETPDTRSKFRFSLFTFIQLFTGNHIHSILFTTGPSSHAKFQKITSRSFTTPLQDRCARSLSSTTSRSALYSLPCVQLSPDANSSIRTAVEGDFSQH